jgi:hypothetical protein
VYLEGTHTCIPDTCKSEIGKQSVYTVTAGTKRKTKLMCVHIFIHI